MISEASRMFDARNDAITVGMRRKEVSQADVVGEAGIMNSETLSFSRTLFPLPKDRPHTRWFDSYMTH